MTVLDAIDAAVRRRDGRVEGREVRFICPAHDDHDPSARWNRGKGVWHCFVCGAGGGWRDLAERLGIHVPSGGKGRRKGRLGDVP